MESGKGSRPERILVVEDHPDSAELLQMILEDKGYEVRCVRTGYEALRVFAAQSEAKTLDWRPDLILIDLRLPDMNGVDVIRELRKSSQSVPPVVLLSADSPQTLENAASGVEASPVRKPFDFDDLYRAIESALAKPRGSNAAGG
jgi:DNA-binding response OmpR family regulator